MVSTLSNSIVNALNYIGRNNHIDYYAYYFYGKARSYAQPYINTNFSASEINENLYIGDFPSACNKGELKELGITHIVTAVVGVEPMFPNDFKYQLVDICDTKTTDISIHFDQCAKFMDDAIENGGKVYVHCMCGISRSATIIAAYLIYKYRFTDDTAIGLLKECRDCIDPNPGFRRQLKIYSDHVNA